jgi:hypothetical protein
LGEPVPREEEEADMEVLALFKNQMQAFGLVDSEGDPATLDFTQPVERVSSDPNVEMNVDPERLERLGHPVDGSVFVARPARDFVSPLDEDGQPIPAVLSVTGDVDTGDGKRHRTLTYAVVFTDDKDLAAGVKPIGEPVELD